jgi:hypothetical protein
MDILAVKDASFKLGQKDFTPFIRYLKETEALIEKGLYSQIFKEYIDRTI